MMSSGAACAASGMVVVIPMPCIVNELGFNKLVHHFMTHRTKLNKFQYFWPVLSRNYSVDCSNTVDIANARLNTMQEKPSIVVKLTKYFPLQELSFGIS